MSTTYVEGIHNGCSPDSYREEDAQSSAQSKKVATHFNGNEITFLMQYTELEYIFN
jgi:hypothetical protein